MQVSAAADFLRAQDKQLTIDYNIVFLTQSGKIAEYRVRKRNS